MYFEGKLTILYSNPIKLIRSTKVSSMQCIYQALCAASTTSMPDRPAAACTWRRTTRRRIVLLHCGKGTTPKHSSELGGRLSELATDSTRHDESSAFSPPQAQTKKKLTWDEGLVAGVQKPDAGAAFIKLASEKCSNIHPNRSVGHPKQSCGDPGLQNHKFTQCCDRSYNHSHPNIGIFKYIVARV